MSPFPYWRLEGSAAPLPQAQVPGAAKLWGISMLSAICILETGSNWEFKLILYFTVETQVQIYLNLFLSLIASGTKRLSCVLKAETLSMLL